MKINSKVAYIYISGFRWIRQHLPKNIRKKIAFKIRNKNIK